MSNIYIMPVIGGIMLFIFHVCLSSIKVLYSINMTSLNWICLCHSYNVATVKVFFAGHLLTTYSHRTFFYCKSLVDSGVHYMTFMTLNIVWNVVLNFFSLLMGIIARCIRCKMLPMLPETIGLYKICDLFLNLKRSSLCHRYCSKFSDSWHSYWRC